MSDPRTFFVTGPGQWGLSVDADTPPEEWQDLPAACAYVICDERQTYDFTPSDYAVWRGNRSERGALALAYLCQRADEDSDNAEGDDESFEEALRSFSRTHFGRNEISYNWSRHEITSTLRRLLGPEAGNIVSIHVHGKTMSVVTDKGEEADLTLTSGL